MMNIREKRRKVVLMVKQKRSQSVSKYVQMVGKMILKGYVMVDLFKNDYIFIICVLLACGHSYCLNCTGNSCTKCREGTLLTGPASAKTCEGQTYIMI